MRSTTGSPLFFKAIAVILVFTLSFLTGCTGAASASCTPIPGPITCTVTVTIKVDPSGADVAAFDATQALVQLSSSNTTLSSTSGTVNLSVTDHSTGQLLGSSSFAYVVQSSSVYAQDPATVHAWLQQFANYADVDVNTSFNTTYTNPSSGTATVNANGLYFGTIYTSSSGSWTGYSGGGNNCRGLICES